MERLTVKVVKPLSYDYFELKGYEDVLCKNICNNHPLSCSDCPINTAIIKLAKYENLEEKFDKIEKQKSDKYKRDTAEQQKMKTPYPYFGQEKRLAVWQEKLDEVKEKYAEMQDAFNAAKLGCIDNVIENQFITVGEWNFGSAISMIMAAVMMLMMMLVRKVEIRNQGGKEE